MDAVNGYRLGETLHEGDTYLTARATRELDGESVVLKAARSATSTADATRLRHEYDIARNVGAGVVRPLALVERGQGAVLVLEDVGGVSLRALQGGAPLALRDFCSIGIQLCDALGRVHAAGIVHGDIKPSNVIVVPATLEARLTDFGIASRVRDAAPRALEDRAPVGTLGYIAPEQTGRTRRVADYRSDLYSLGATFYELLTGRLPFDLVDPLELVHAHLARQPAPPCEVLPTVPKVLSDLVLKLLAKAPAARYQSAFGVATDLRRCLVALEATGVIAPFVTGAGDVPAQFTLPKKLYGRETQREVLVAAFERVAAGVTEAVLVAGYSGIGKSSLVRDVSQLFTRRRALFAAGKFDQFQRNVPFSAMRQAFQEVVGTLLAADADRLARWQKDLRAALGSNGRVLIELVPQFELLLGAQPPVAMLGPTETENRFNLVVGQLVGVLASADHPLVFFLDDLQWADGASLRLFRTLLTTNEWGHVLLLGAYRDNEVDAGHPLTSLLAELKAANAALATLALGPLDLASVHALVTDALWATPAACLPLAALVHDKTHGNPYFVDEFLGALARKGLLYFDPTLGRWGWDVDAIRREGITDNVVVLLTQRLGELPETTREALQWAACLGHTFDLATLALVTGREGEALRGHLANGLHEGLIVAIAEPGDPDAAPAVFAFQHDRVHEAAYASTPEVDRPTRHRHVGRLLLGGDAAAVEARLFEIVGHLNAARHLLTNDGERYELATLNLRAARKAKAAAAHEPAWRFLKDALALLPTESWEASYALTFELHLETAEASYAMGRYADVDPLREIVLAKAKTPIERARFLVVQITCYTSQLALRKAVETGLEALRILGEPLTSRPTKLNLLREVIRAGLKRGSRSLRTLGEAPEMTDPGQSVVVQVLQAIASPAYLGMPALMPFVSLKMASTTMRYGLGPAAAVSYAMYALVLVALGDLDTAYAFGELAFELGERFAGVSRGRSLFLLGTFVSHWKRPLRDAIATLESAERTALEYGDLEFYAHARNIGDWYRVFQGDPLGALGERVRASEQSLRKHQQVQGTLLATSLGLIVDDLVGGPAASVRRAEERKILEVLEREDDAASANLHTLRGIERYFAADYPAALESFASVDVIRDAIVAMLHVPEHRWFQALSHLALDPSPSFWARLKTRVTIRVTRWRIKKWARHAPSNHAHRYHLLEAEWGRVSGAALDTTVKHYEQAITLAKANGFLQDEALACERFARFLLRQSKDLAPNARAQILKAHALYQQWGALAVAGRVEREFPAFFVAPAPLMQAVAAEPAALAALRSRATSTASSAQLDLHAILRAAQALSREIVLGDLLTTLMRTMLESAGAERGALLLAEDGILRVEATASSAHDAVVRHETPPPADEATLPLSIVQYVLRTRQEVVIDDARADERFASDPYVGARPTFAVLCLPLLSHGAVAGVLYFENGVTDGAFTPARLETLHLLSAQAAISLENARLFAHLEKAAAERLIQQRLEQEIEIGARIQTSILPRSLDCEGLEGAASMVPASEVGGDYFDFFAVDGGAWIGIGDVAGHGLTSGLIMMMAQSMIATLGRSRPEAPPSEILSAVNAVLYENIRKRLALDEHMTLSILRYYADGRVNFAGSHEDIIVWRAETGRCETISTSGPWVGAMPEIARVVVSSSLTLKDGDLLVLYTDGITEARDVTGGLFGIERLCAAIERASRERVGAIRSSVVGQVNRWKSRQDDDETLLVFRYQDRTTVQLDCHP